MVLQASDYWRKRYSEVMPLDLHGIDEESTVRIERDHRMSSEEFFHFCIANPGLAN
jgi:hypothetical protein